MLWLDVDATLRRVTNNKKSINDFCRVFHGGPGGEPELKTYTFDDIVSALNGLAPYDWAGFLRERLDATPAKTPLESVENSGWKLVYNEQPNDYQQNADTVRKRLNLDLSIGLVVDHDGLSCGRHPRWPCLQGGHRTGNENYGGGRPSIHARSAQGFD